MTERRFTIPESAYDKARHAFVNNLPVSIDGHVGKIYLIEPSEGNFVVELWLMPNENPIAELLSVGG